MISPALPLAVLAASTQVLDWDFVSSMTHVRSAQPTAEGLWCATSGGVFFYDYDQGFTAEYLYPHDLPHHAVEDVLQDSQGRLWCATGNGLAVLENGGWTVYTSFDGIPGSGEVRVVEEAGSWIWAGTDGGLAGWTGSGFLHMDEALTRGGFTAGEVDALLERDDSLWIATEIGVFSLDLGSSPYVASSWHHWAAETGGLGIRGFLATPDSLYAFGSGVFRRDPGAWTVLLDYSSHPDSMILGLASTSDGLVAAGCGVRRRIAGTAWERWGEGFPPGTQATFLAEGGGSLWCGAGSQHWTNTDYGAGLARLNPEGWTLVLIPGLPAGSCYQPAIIDGTLYCGSHNRGLMARYGNEWRYYGPFDGLPNTLRVYPVADAPGEAVWTASYHYGLTWLWDSGAPSGADDILMTFVSDSIQVNPPVPQMEAPLLNNQAVCLASSGETLWIGQEPFWTTPDEPSGLAVCVGDPAAGDLEWAAFTVDDGLASGAIRSLLLTGDGGIWIAFAGDAGCQYLDFGGTPLIHSDDSWLPAPNQSWGMSSGLPSSQVLSFCRDREGGVLIGTGAGLSRWTAGAGFSTVAGVDGAIKAIALDGDGTAWCLGSSAVWAVDGAEVVHYDRSNSPFLPVNRVENEFAAWDPSEGRIIFSSRIGMWMIRTAAGSAGGGGPRFHPQPFLPGDGGVLSLAGVPDAPVTVRVFSVDGAFVASISADSPGAWSWDGRTEGGNAAGGVYFAVVEADGVTSVTKLAVVR